MAATTIGPGAPAGRPALAVRLGHPRAFGSGRAEPAMTAALGAVLAGLGAIEVQTPPSVTLGGFALVVVLVAAWLLSVRGSLLVAGGALAIPMVAIGVGADDRVGAEVQILAVLSLTLVVQVAVQAVERYQGLLAQRNRDLSRLNASLERFTADAAHEFRAPLTLVRTEVETALARARPPEEYRRHLEAIGTEVARMQRSVTGLLTLARADAGMLRAAFRRIDLVDLLEVVLERWRSMAAGRGVLLAGDLPDAGEITCDPDLLVRVVDNLLDNALHAVPDGGRIDVGARLEGGEWVITVSDTGPGLDTAAAAALLGGARGGSRSRDAGGNGFGLALCAAVARAHGGSIGVGSGPGGALLTVHLPAAGSPPG